MLNESKILMYDRGSLFESDITSQIEFDKIK